MLAPPREPQDYRWAASGSETCARLRQPLNSGLIYRSKDDLDQLMPLPRWASWALMAWTIGTATLYTTILVRWWE